MSDYFNIAPMIITINPINENILSKLNARKQ